jgi:hypothetical protein
MLRPSVTGKHHSEQRRAELNGTTSFRDALCHMVHIARYRPQVGAGIGLSHRDA